MLKRLEDLRRQEDAFLASYAMRNASSRGRKHPEPEHPFRTAFQRDRDRILHSRPFRRLESKTQVFLDGAGDHYRTRLTHTIEVAAIARTIARCLGLNEDLAETISLAHDLGHPPFGHAGERELNDAMAGHGGFDHNDQALKIVEVLERKYPDFDGLNLTWDVRAGLVKHRSGRVVLLDGEPLPPCTSLEAQAADIADDITYYGHDVDDGLGSGLISEERLETLPIWMEAVDATLAKGVPRSSDKFRPMAVRNLIDAMVGDAIRASAAAIERLGLSRPEDAQALDAKVLSFSPLYAEETRKLRAFLHENLYFNPAIAALNDSAMAKIRELFAFYLRTPTAMGRAAQARIAVDGLHRAVADYIAGMTDRYAMREHARLCG